MTDKEKLTAIKENVLARYKSNTECENNAAGGRYYAARADEDRELLSFVDSMQKEPVSEDLEEALECKVRAIFDSLEKFDVNDKEKNRVAFGLIELEAYAKMFYNIGKQAGAQWKKQQMMKNCLDYTIMKAQYCDEHLPPLKDLATLPLIRFSPAKLLERGLKVGDKVKIIIVKED